MSILTSRRDEQERTTRRRFTSAPAPGRAPSLLDSFNYAFEGIIHVLRTQRNLRIHLRKQSAPLRNSVEVWGALGARTVTTEMIGTQSIDRN